MSRFLRLIDACIMLGVDLRRCQNAFPLPYGENLGETEAFHLIRAFELYNELKNLISEIQVNSAAAGY